MKLVIVDYQLGNLFSVKQACHKLGYSAELISDPGLLSQADAAILPGVGAFAAAMGSLQQSGMDDALKAFVASGKPFFGVCLGMQLLFSGSEEFDQMQGLDLIQGRIRRIPSDGRRVPQIGWNKIRPSSQDWMSSPLRDVPVDSFMYFVHSYYCDAQEMGVELCRTDYDGFEYCSAVRKDNVFATQFHPEKSGPAGLSIYENWLKSI